ncbi:MAG: hypothetical protein JXX14_25540 [Deltaproteobacteria bacterium]|nr:hypothetical protein [Deltaproteobacteria bacterium]
MTSDFKFERIMFTVFTLVCLACAPAPPLPEPVPIPAPSPNESAATPPPPGEQKADAKQKPDETATQEQFIEYRYYPTAKDALLDIVTASKPKVIGFGEYHAQTGNSVQSALSHFTNELLPAISSVTSDIVVEAMVTEGNCFELEQQVTTEVKEDTQRPDETVDEVSILFEQARAKGVIPHPITMTCEDHQSIYGEEVDYEKLLKLIGNKLLEETTRILNARASEYRENSRPLIAVYSGAIHNDAHPQKEWRRYAFGQRLQKQLPQNKYVEVDLIVPELVRDISFIQDAQWFPLLKDKVSSKKHLLIRRSATNFILVFPGNL